MTSRKKYFIAALVLSLIGVSHYFLNYHNLFGFLIHEGLHFGRKAEQFTAIHWRAYPKAMAQDENPETQHLVSPHHQKPSNLLPESCGQCHFKAHKEWKNSTHSNPISPRIEIMDIGNLNTDRCLPCHSPLLEQNKKLQSGIANPLYHKPLYRKGISCTVCHIRDGRIIGSLRVKQGLQDPKFCIGCHQGDELVGIKIKGEDIFNVYEEWLKSPAAKKNITCQSCHMKDGSHAILSGKDPAWIEEFLDAKIEKISTDEYKYTLTNSRDGHYFPGALSARAKIQIVAIDNDGKTIKSKHKIIQRELDTARLTYEKSNTRLKTGESVSVVLKVPKNSNFKVVRGFIELNRDFFRETIYGNPGFNESQAEKNIRIKALNKTLNNSIIIFKKELSLKE